MEVGIKAWEIMEEKFPIIDSSLTIEKVMKKLNSNEACLVINNGVMHSILSNEDILKAYLKNNKDKKTAIKNIKSNQNFLIVSPETDVGKIIDLMKDYETDFVIVKSFDRIGLITKKEITEINQELFDNLFKKLQSKVKAI